MEIISKRLMRVDVLWVYKLKKCLGVRNTEAEKDGMDCCEN